MSEKQYRISYSVDYADKEVVVDSLELATRITTSMDILGIGYMLGEV